jgi:hypothetical protein
VVKSGTLAVQCNLPKTTEHRKALESIFQDVRRRKRNATYETAGTSKEAAVQTKTLSDLSIPSRQSSPEILRPPPLREADMNTDASGTEDTSNEGTVPGKTSRPPAIILTSTTNLIQFQEQLKNEIKQNFEFRSIRNGTRVITRSMAGFQSVKSYYDANKMSYYSFHPKSEKSMKAVIG